MLYLFLKKSNNSSELFSIQLEDGDDDDGVANQTNETKTESFDSIHMAIK